MTENEQARLAILNLANERGKFVIAVGEPLSEVQAEALENLQVERLIELIDVSLIAARPGVFRVFLLTDPGYYARAVLRGERAP